MVKIENILFETNYYIGLLQNHIHMMSKIKPSFPEITAFLKN